MAKIKITIETAENGLHFTHDGKTFVFADPSILGDMIKNGYSDLSLWRCWKRWTRNALSPQRCKGGEAMKCMRCKKTNKNVLCHKCRVEIERLERESLRRYTSFPGR